MQHNYKKAGQWTASSPFSVNYLVIAGGGSGGGTGGGFAGGGGGAGGLRTSYPGGSGGEWIF